jgi:hypothetical protein
LAENMVFGARSKSTRARRRWCGNKEVCVACRRGWCRRPLALTGPICCDVLDVLCVNKLKYKIK